jgi:hypothetical protein
MEIACISQGKLVCWSEGTNVISNSIKLHFESMCSTLNVTYKFPKTLRITQDPYNPGQSKPNARPSAIKIRSTATRFLIKLSVIFFNSLLPMKAPEMAAKVAGITI